MKIINHEGVELTVDDLAIPEQLSENGPTDCMAGYFHLFFMDVINGTSQGFDHPTLGQARADVVCRVFTDLSELIIPTNQNNEVRIKIKTSIIGQGAGAAAEPLFVFVDIPGNNSGVEDPETWKTINGGVDSWAQFQSCQQLAHGLMTVRFDNTIPYNLDPDTATLPGEVDFYTVILHEALHLLGIYTRFTIDNGQVRSNMSSGNFFTRYDTYLETSSNTPLLSNNCYQNTINATATDLTSGCNTVFYNSNRASNEVVYSPVIWSNPSSLSHLQCSSSIFPCPFPLPNDYVMTPCAGTGSGYDKRHPNLTEKNILCDLGYNTSDHYGVANTSTYFSYGQTCNVNCPGIVAGVNDLLDVNGNRYKLINNTAGTAFIDIPVLANDINADSASCVRIMNAQGSAFFTGGQNIRYIPTANYTGIVYISYIPICAAGSTGNITYVAVYVYPPCNDPCNLVCGGDFEYYDLNSNPDLHRDFLINGNLSNTPDICSDSSGNIYVGIAGYNSNPEGIYFELNEPIYAGCSATFSFRASAYYNVSYRYPLFAEFYGNTIAPCTKPNCFIDLPCSSNSGCSAWDANCQLLGRIAITDTVLGNGSLCIDMPNLAPYSFVFHNNTPSNIKYIVIRPNNNVNAFLYIDDIKVENNCADAGPDLPICQGDSAQLIVNYQGGSPPYSYAWTPTATLNDPNIKNPVASPTVTTTYSVTVTDSNNCSGTDSVTVYVNDTACCAFPGDYSLAYPVDYASNYPNGFTPGSRIHITGNFIIDVPVFTFDSMEVVLYKNSIIEIKQNNHLIITNNSMLRGCKFKWHRIELKNGAKITVDKGSIIKDGRKAVFVQGHNKTVNIDNALFLNNNVGIYLAYYSDSARYPLSVKNSTFDYDPLTDLSSTLTEHAGIYILDCMPGHPDTPFVEIGNANQPPYSNSFKNLDYGVYCRNSRVWLFNNDFFNCNKGVYADETTVTTMKSIMIGFYPNILGGNFSNRFYKCYEGIYVVDNYDVYILDNIFDDINTDAIEIRRCYENNKIKISSNNIYDFTDRGIFLYNINGSDVTISGNTIKPTFNTSNNNSSFARTAIRVDNIGGSSQPLSVNISSNEIENVQVGIHNIRVQNLNVSGNTVMFGFPPNGQLHAYGMWVENCPEAYIGANNITGTSTNTGSNQEYGINIETSEDFLIKSNNISTATFCINVKGDNLGTNPRGFLQCNNMSNYYYGVGIEDIPTVANVFQFGPVEGDNPDNPSENTWDISTTPPPFDTWCYATILGLGYSDGSLLEWWVRNAATPNIWWPDPNGVNSSAANPVGALLQRCTLNCYSPCDGSQLRLGSQTATTSLSPAERRNRFLKPVVLAAIRQTLSGEAFDLPLYENLRAVYAYFQKHPQMLSLGRPDDALFMQFMSNLRNSNIAKLYRIDKLISSGNYTDAEALNHSFTPENRAESNYKTVNAILLKSLQLPRDTSRLFPSASPYPQPYLSSNDSAMLKAIADADVTVAGYAVYRARAMLSIDYYRATTTGAKLNPSNPIAGNPSIYLFPNPVDRLLLVVYEGLRSQNNTLELIDISGKILYQARINPDGFFMEIDASALKPGIYFYRVASHEKQFASGKFIIQ